MRSPLLRSRTTSLARRQGRTMVAPIVRRASSVASTSRSTSARRTTTPAIERPRISRSRSRAIVSVSGSSGTRLPLAGDLAPPDVGAVLLAGELDLLGVPKAGSLGFLDRRRHRAHLQHPPPGPDEAALLVPRRAGTDNKDALRARP